MVDFQSPRVSVQQVRRGAVSLTGIAVAVGGLLGTFLRGPVNKPIEINGYGDAVEVFGGPLAAGDEAWEGLKGFFDEGGGRLVVVRAIGADSANAARTLNTGTGATKGSLSSNAGVFPVALLAGETFTGKVDGGGAVTATFAATPATFTLTGGSYAAGAGGDSLTFSVVVMGVTISTTVDLSAVAGTQVAYLAAMNGIPGVKAVSSGLDIVLTTDQKGSGAALSLTAIGGAAAAKTGAVVGAGTNAGPNDVVNIAQTTAAEFVTKMETTFAGSTTTNNGDGSVTWETDTAGAGGSVQFTAGTGVSKIAGFDLAVHSGAASGLTAAVVVSASSPGAWANDYKVKATRKDTNVAKTTVTAAGATSSLTLSSAAKLKVGDTVSITKVADVQRGVVKTLNGAVVTLLASITVPGGGYDGSENVVLETFRLDTYDETGSLVQTDDDLRVSSTAGPLYFVNALENRNRSLITASDSAPAQSDKRPVTDTVATAFTGGLNGGALSDSTYVGSQSGRSGLYAFNQNRDVNMIVVPGQTGQTFAVGFQTYLETRGDVMGILDTPAGYSESSAVSWLEGLGIASQYIAVHYTGLKVVDVVNGGYLTVRGSGHRMGRIARTIRERTFQKAPAGTLDGRFRSILGVERDVDQAGYDLLYPAKINATQVLEGGGFALMGAITLDPSGEFGDWGTQYGFNIAKRETRKRLAAVGAQFENNDSNLWALIKRTLTPLFREWREKGILSGANDDESFYIICDETLNTALVRRQKKCKFRVGLAFNEPAVFIEGTLEIDDRAIQAELNAGV